MRDDNPVGTAGAAIGKGVASGLTATAGFWSDVVGAFGDVQAGYGAQADPALLVDPEARRKFADQGADAAARVQSGDAFSSQIGSRLYGIAAGFNPDPMTSNVVDRTLFGFTSVGARALGYSLAGGPLVGAALTAADVGSEASQRLKEQGVDIGTRTAVGAVEGAGAGLGVVAPIAGNTLLKTAALVAGAGPGAYVAQTAATKAILENAGYDKIANQYDPFDPVGLAVSTAVPAFFGAVHMRGAARAPAAAPGTPAARPLADMSASELKAVPHNDPRLDDYATQVEQHNGLPPGVIVALKNAGERSNSNQVSSAGARGVMQFTDSTWNAYGRGDRTNPLDSIDAAGRYLPDLIKQYDGDVRAAVAAYNGGTKAGDAVHAGRAAPTKETRDYLSRVQQYLSDGGAQEMAGRRVPTPDEVDAARVALNRDLIDRTNLANPDDVQGLAENLTAFQRAQDQMGLGARVEVSDTLRPETLNQASAMDDMISRMEAQHADLTATAGNAAERGDVSAMRAQLNALEQNPPSLDTITQNLQPRRTYEVTKTRAAREQAQTARDAQAEFESQTAAQQEQITRLRSRIDENAQADTARQQLQILEPALQNLRTARAAIDAPATRRNAIADAVGTLAREAPPEARIPNADTAAPRVEPTAETSAAPRETAAPASDTAAAGSEAGTPVSETASSESATPETAAAAPSPESAPHLDAAIADLAAANPDAIVSVEINGEVKDVPLSEALAAIQAEAAREKADAPLLDVAANCFIRTQEFE